MTGYQRQLFSKRHFDIIWFMNKKGFLTDLSYGVLTERMTDNG